MISTTLKQFKFFAQKTPAAIVLGLALACPALHAEETTYPQALLQMDSFFSHHVLVAEKSTHQIHLFENDGGKPRLIKSYQVATGKKSGDKTFQGDHRTPEGVYFFTDFIPHEKLLQIYGKEGVIYGVGAFVMDYPNPMDHREQKTGSGIWLHSTNDETRIDKGLDSRGCIVTANEDLKNISQYIELGKTTVIVLQDIQFLKENAWTAMRTQIQESLDKWSKAWANEDLDAYMAFYHPQDFRDGKGNYNQYKNYKKAVFANPGKPQIDLSHVSILSNGDYAVATFVQSYHSNTINDSGKKTLYLKRDEYYQWKIVSENFSKIPASELTTQQVAFRPSMRFFKVSDSAKGSN